MVVPAGPLDGELEMLPVIILNDEPAAKASGVAWNAIKDRVAKQSVTTKIPTPTTRSATRRTAHCKRFA